MSAAWTTTLATRRLSISATRSSQPSNVDPLALFGDVAEGVEEIAAERHVLPLGQVDAELLADVIDAGAAVDQPTGAVDPDDVGFATPVELVAEVADQRREEVLHGEHAGHAAVLVDDHGEGTAVAAHVGEDVEDEPGLGYQIGLAEPAGDVEGGGLVGGPASAPLRPSISQPVRKRSFTKRTPMRWSRSSS